MIKSIFLCTILIGGSCILQEIHAKKERIKKTISLNESASSPSHNAHANQESPDSYVPTITIWIHGTTPSIARLPINTLQRFFYTKSGIFDPRTLDPAMHRHTIGMVLTNSDAALFPADHFYMFGWSGALSFSARQQAAEQLYTALIALRSRYQQLYNSMPRIRLITHSHGGNVALNMAAIAQQPTHNLVIDELILLACPVQDHTAVHIENPIFKQIYSLYSTKDFLQTIDPQQLYSPTKTTSFFSRRRFKPHQKIRQVKIQINKRPISHLEFILSRFIGMLPKILSEIKAWSCDTWHSPFSEHTLCISTHNHKRQKILNENPYLTKQHQ